MLWCLPIRKEVGRWSEHFGSSLVASSSPSGATSYGVSGFSSASSSNSSRVTPSGDPVCMSMKKDIMDAKLMTWMIRYDKMHTHKCP